MQKEERDLRDRTKAFALLIRPHVFHAPEDNGSASAGEAGAPVWNFNRC